jgi:guanine deaminase
MDLWSNHSSSWYPVIFVDWRLYRNLKLWSSNLTLPRWLAFPRLLMSRTLIIANSKGTLKQVHNFMSEDFMCRAIALALENVRNGQGGPFAALVVKDGQILAEGANRVTITHDPTAHAEIVAIREACRKLGDFQLSGCDLYTTCEPCPMCLGAIYWARPSRIFYACLAADAAAAGFDDAFIYEELERPLDARRIPMQQLLRDDSLEIFSLWKRQENKTPY